MLNFAIAADELQQQEFARLAAAVTPRIEALRSLADTSPCNALRNGFRFSASRSR